MLPHDLLPKSTVYDYFAQWRDNGTWQNILDALRREVRTAVGKEPSPSAGSIDSQTVKASEIADDRGYDGGKKITGRKQHIIVNTLGANRQRIAKSGGSFIRHRITPLNVRRGRHIRRRLVAVPTCTPGGERHRRVAPEAGDRVVQRVFSRPFVRFPA